MVVKSLNDVFKIMFNYGACDQQFFFVVNFLISCFKNWNASDFSDCIINDYISVKKDDNKGFYMNFKKNYYYIMHVDNPVMTTISYHNKTLNISIWDSSKKEVYFAEILEDGTTISYYDESGYELGIKQEGYLHLGSTFKNMPPKTKCYLDSDESYNKFLEKLNLLKTSTLKTAIFYYDDENKLKVL